MIYHEIIIIGGGASGLFVGANLKNKDYLIIEKNHTPAAKVLISGGSRCNITNANILAKNYLADEFFINEVLKNFSQKTLFEWFYKFGVSFKIQKDSQYFCDKGAKAVVLALLRANSSGEILCDTDVLSVSLQENRAIKANFILHTNKGEFACKKLIVASGGVSYKKLGVSDIATQIADHFHLQNVALKPALVGLSVQKEQFWFKNLSGVSLFVKLKVAQRNICADMLFTHRGISGPAVLNASLFWEKGTITADFLPNFEFKNSFKTKKIISSSLGLPKSFIKEFLKAQNLEDKPYCAYSKDEIKELLRLKSYEFAPAGNFGFDRAEITKGGVATSEISPINFEAKKLKNLHFIGEALDVNGMLGGYNLHFAFASGYLCAKYLNRV